MYYFEDAVAEETKAAGCAVCWANLYRFPVPDIRTKPKCSLTERFLKKWQGDPLIQPQ